MECATTKEQRVRSMISIVIMCILVIGWILVTLSVLSSIYGSER